MSKLSENNLRLIENLKAQGYTIQFDVSMFRQAMFGINRTDCKWLAYQGGHRFAQYNNALIIVFLEKGKRKTMQTYLAENSPWLVLIETYKAVKRPPTMEKHESGGTITRFSSYSPEWVHEFEQQLEGVEVLLKLDKNNYNCYRPTASQGV